MIDAITNQPVPNATVLLWDLADIGKQPRIGFGIYMTDIEGSYSATYPYVMEHHIYRMYAYRRDPSTGVFDYVPSSAVKIEQTDRPSNVSFRLVPGASVHLKGEILYVESKSPAYGITVSVIDPRTGEYPQISGANYNSVYGSGSEDAWFLFGNLSEKVVIVPADVNLFLRVQSTFDVDGFLKTIAFFIDNDTHGFSFKQGQVREEDISKYTIGRNLEVIDVMRSLILQELDNASRSGFIVFEEKATMGDVLTKIVKSKELSESDPVKGWIYLREAYVEILNVRKTLQFMRLASISNAMYIPWFLALYATILGFFFFEDDRRKLVSILFLYISLMAVFLYTYPGTSLLSGSQSQAFLISSVISILLNAAIAFLLPRLFTATESKGELSFGTVASTIFSLAKRQVKRRKNRSLFTLASLFILVMAFTALTSFGTVYGIVHRTETSRDSAQGFLVRRGFDPINFMPIQPSDLGLLENVPGVGQIAPKTSSRPDSKPIGEIISESGYSSKIYGAVGFDPTNELRYVDLRKLVTFGRFLSHENTDEAMVSKSVGLALRLNAGSKIMLYVTGVPHPIEELTVVGFFDDQAFNELKEIDGEPYAPFKLVKSDEILVYRQAGANETLLLNWRTALNIQNAIISLQPEGYQEFSLISRLTFEFDEKELPRSDLVRTLVFAMEYTVEVVADRSIELYYVGYYYEARGAAEIAIPILMVVLNVGAIMLNAVYERRNEMKALTLLGLNPFHVGLLFVAEAITLGLLGGGIGYLLGLSFQRLMVILGRDIMVKPKIEWWWSFIGLGLSLVVSVISSLRPAITAVETYTPSMVKRIKLSGEERQVRRAEVFKTFVGREVGMPIRVLEPELELFTSYVIERLKDLSLGVIERVEDIELSPLTESEGKRRISIKFKHMMVDVAEPYGTSNELLCTKGKEEEYYRVSLRYAPIKPGIPEAWADRTIDTIHDISISWVKYRIKTVR